MGTLLHFAQHTLFLLFVVSDLYERAAPRKQQLEHFNFKKHKISDDMMKKRAYLHHKNKWMKAMVVFFMVAKKTKYAEAQWEFFFSEHLIFPFFLESNVKRVCVCVCVCKRERERH